MTPVTQTETVQVTVKCSGQYPFGSCDAGKACLGGACVDTATLCSPTNLAGACGTGMTCFGGGCVLSTALCSPAAPAGPCAIGSTCFMGGCVATNSLCSSSNQTGTCPPGETCQEGACAAPGVDPCTVKAYSAQPAIGVDTKTAITVDSLQFRDASGDGQLQPYEDWRLSEICRAKDLVARMSVPEKIGLMGEGGTIGSSTVDGVLPQGTQDNIVKLHIRQALIRLGASGKQLAVYLNNVQKLSEAQPWGIPFVITTDPSNGFGMDTNANTGVQTLSVPATVSAWPYPLGLGAINDAAVTRLYGDTVRKEFMAMGFRWQLGPMADVATEPRWARVQNTFGENAYAVAKHSRACIEGFQGQGDGGLRNGIAATIKHFPGAGADDGGRDSHSVPGKYNVYPGNNFEYHQIAFRAAIDAGGAAVMPCYSIFKGQTKYNPEQTGAAFSKGLVTDYLKTTLGFSGMVTSDWGTMAGTSWGVEGLTQPERAAMFLRAGSHQLGSDSISIIQAAFDQGLITEAEINPAATKILEMSFRLGIFENPYVDAEKTSTVTKGVEARTSGFIAQKKAVVILRNRDHAIAQSSPKYLPIDGTRYTDLNKDGAPQVGEYYCDANGNGTVEVYYDGVVDGIVADPNKPDGVNDVYGDYDYSAAAAGASIGVVTQADATKADIAVVRITARKGTYFGLDMGVPLAHDFLYPGVSADGGAAAALKDRNRVVDLLRVRDGYTKSDGTKVAAANPKLKIVVVMHMDRPSVVRWMINGLKSVDELPGMAGSYPQTSDDANVRTDGLGGIDAFLVEFGAFDRAVLDVVFNKNAPTSPVGYFYGQSRLPMEIPNSEAEVMRQFEDLPADTHAPTFALGAGSTY